MRKTRHPPTQIASSRLRRVVEYTSCPFCDAWSIGLLATGRIVRHSVGFGAVEKVGPGTRHPFFKTQICKGSGYHKKLSPVGQRNAKRLAAQSKQNS